jgi:hypothetical protein
VSGPTRGMAGHRNVFGHGPNVDKEKAFFSPSAAGGCDIGWRVSSSSDALAVADAAPSASATTLFAREAFSLSSLQPQLTLALALVLTLSHLQLRILSSSILRLISYGHPNFTLLPRTLASPESPSCGQASKARKCVSRDVDKTARVSSRGRQVP